MKDQLVVILLHNNTTLPRIADICLQNEPKKLGREEQLAWSPLLIT